MSHIYTLFVPRNGVSIIIWLRIRFQNKFFTVLHYQKNYLNILRYGMVHYHHSISYLRSTRISDMDQNKSK